MLGHRPAVQHRSGLESNARTPTRGRSTSTPSEVLYTLAYLDHVPWTVDDRKQKAARAEARYGKAPCAPYLSIDSFCYRCCCAMGEGGGLGMGMETGMRMGSCGGIFGDR